MVFLVLVSGALLALILGLGVSYRLMARARAADEQYRHLFETAGDAIIIADDETGIIRDANAKLAELTGIPIMQLLGTKEADLFGREIPAIPGASNLEVGDLVIRHVSGASIPVDVRVSRSRVGSQVVDYSIVRDVRERQRVEAALHEAARLESAGRLAGGVAHDFNNLLTVIVGYTQSLTRLTSGEAREKVVRIRKAADRAAALVRQLLAFSRKQPLIPQVLDLNRIIRGMHDMIRGLVNEQIELIFELAPDLGGVEADAHQIEQIILNLVTNARDAMPSCGQLIIRTWNEDSESIPYVGFSITDTGQGMDEATRSRVFEPFFTTKSQGRGTGLGLSTVHGTVKQSRGEISVESALAKGTTFRILLPRTNKPQPDEPAAVMAGEQRGTETILLVEDDPAVREALIQGLELQGYRIYAAANGRDGLEQFMRYSTEVALVVTDLMMPEMGGVTFGEQLREAGVSVPILYITGYHQDLDKYASQELPLKCGLLLKPFSPKDLAEAIHAALDRRSSSAVREAT